MSWLVHGADPTNIGVGGYIQPGWDGGPVIGNKSTGSIVPWGDMRHYVVQWHPNGDEAALIDTLDLVSNPEVQLGFVNTVDGSTGETVATTRIPARFHGGLTTRVQSTLYFWGQRPAAASPSAADIGVDFSVVEGGTYHAGLSFARTAVTGTGPLHEGYQPVLYVIFQVDNVTPTSATEDIIVRHEAYVNVQMQDIGTGAPQGIETRWSVTAVYGVEADHVGAPI